MSKKGIEMPGGDLSGFLLRDSSASSRFQVHNTVTSESDSRRHAPTIPIAARSPSRANRSTRSVESAEQEAEDKKNKRQRAAAIAASALLDETRLSRAPSFSSFDEEPGLRVAERRKGRARSKSTACSARRMTIDRNYELELQRRTAGNCSRSSIPKTEASVENAFQRALRLQP